MFLTILSGVSQRSILTFQYTLAKCTCDNFANLLNLLLTVSIIVVNWFRQNKMINVNSDTNHTN